MSRDPARALEAALLAQFAGFPGSAAIDERHSIPWASATFGGARHRVALRLEGPGADAAGDRFLDGLSERDFNLPGHIVADIALLSDARRDGGIWARIEIEALTVEEG